MESLGGDRGWAERFIAEHAAILYYWVGWGGVLPVMNPGSKIVEQDGKEGSHAALRLIL